MSSESHEWDKTEQKTKEKEKTKEKQETKNEKETKEEQETNKSKQRLANFGEWVNEYIKTEKDKEKFLWLVIKHFKKREKSIENETKKNTEKDKNDESKEKKPKKKHRRLKWKYTKTLNKIWIPLTDKKREDIIKNHDEKELKRFNKDLNKAIKNHKFKEEFLKKREGKGFDDLLTEIKDEWTSKKDKKDSKKEKKEKKNSHKHRKHSDNSSSSNEWYSKTTDDSSESSNWYSEFGEQSSDTNNSSESENNLDAYTNEHIPEEKVKEARDYISNWWTFHSPSKWTISRGRGKYKHVCSTWSYNVLWRLGLPKVSNSTECDLKWKVLPKMGLKYIWEVDPDNPEKNWYKPQNWDTAVWPRFNGTQHQATFINWHWVSDTIQRKMSCYNAKNEPMVKVYRYTWEQIT